MQRVEKLMEMLEKERAQIFGHLARMQKILQELQKELKAGVHEEGGAKEGEQTNSEKTKQKSKIWLLPAGAKPRKKVSRKHFMYDLDDDEVEVELDGFDEVIKEEMREEIKRKETKGITEKQRKFIWVMVNNLGWTEQEFKGWLKHLTGKESIAELSLNEASKVIAELKRQGR